MAESTTRDFDWAALVKANEGTALTERPTEYQFSNGKQFKAPLIPYQSDIPEAPTP